MRSYRYHLGSLLFITSACGLFPKQDDHQSSRQNTCDNSSANPLRALVGCPPSEASNNVMSSADSDLFTTQAWVSTQGSLVHKFLRVEEPSVAFHEGKEVGQPLRVAVGTRIIVQHNDRQIVENYAAQHRGKVIKTESSNHGVYLVDFTETAVAQEVATRPEFLVQQLRAATLEGLIAEPDWVVSVGAPLENPMFDVPTGSVPDPKVPANLWGLHNFAQDIDGKIGIDDADIDAPEGWSRVYNSVPPRAVTVAVIDTGVDYTHPEFNANGVSIIDTVNARDFANDDNDATDDNGHGTHCAGTIAGSHDAAGVVGVANYVKILPLKFITKEGFGYTSDAIDAVNYLNDLHQSQDNLNPDGPNIVLSSNSWGGGGKSEILRQAILKGGNTPGIKPIFFVAAAGNDGANNDTVPQYPSSFDADPGQFDNIISVGASTNNDERAYFSNYGARNVDLFAPGEGIYSAWPPSLNAGSYRFARGTSMATPHVSGALAVLHQKFPNEDGKLLRKRLLSSTDAKSGFEGLAASSGRLNLANATLDQGKLAITGYRLDDSKANGDGFANPGETIQVFINVKNIGGGLLSGRAEVTSLTSGIEIISGAIWDVTVAEWSQVESAPTTIKITSAQPVVAKFRVVLAGDSPEGTVLSLPIIESFNVRGQVTENGVPVPKYQVLLQQNGLDIVRTVTNADGVYVLGIPDSGAGPYHLVAPTQSTANGDFVGFERGIDLTSDVVQDIAFAKQEVLGSVVDTQGMPVKDAKVRMLVGGGAFSSTNVSIDGTFRFDNWRFPLGQPYRNSATLIAGDTAHGYIPQRTDTWIPMDSSLIFRLKLGQYKVTELDDYANASALSDDGWVTINHAGFGPQLWHDKQVEPLTGFGSADGINVNHTVVGNTVRGGVIVAAVKLATQQVQSVGFPVGWNQATAIDINENGSLIGYGTKSGNFLPFILVPRKDDGGGLIWNPTDGENYWMTALSTSGERTIPTGINKFNEVVGWSSNSPNRAFLWSEQMGFKLLEQRECGNMSVATGINGLGQVVGYVGSCAVIWNRNPGEDASTAVATRFDAGTPVSMNDHLEIIGEDPFSVAIFWRLDPKTLLVQEKTDLRDYTPIELGWNRFLWVTKINECGQIIGEGTLNVHGVGYRGFLLTPTQPRPAMEGGPPDRCIANHKYKSNLPIIIRK